MKIFIDAGFYIGKALEYYAPFIDDSWTVYVFEPNDTLDIEKTMERFPFKIQWIKKAVWTEDGVANFTISEREDAARLSQIRDLPSTGVEVETIDFSRFIKELPEDADIVCSMDIEGAEYPVLRKMLKEGTAQRLSLLDIEFHDRLLINEDSDTSSQLRQELERNGILVKLKI